jgi:hypothetical protein
MGTKFVLFIDDLPRMLPTKLRLIWQRGFRGDNFLEINQSETRIVCGADFLKFVFILLDIGPAPRNFLLDPLNFCWTYIFYVKLF